MSTRPIGIFDSGIGGLTVAKEIAQHLPNESFIYFGDTAHTPWGDKSVKAIENFCAHITTFLKNHHCKMIVIACNTASCIGESIVRNLLTPDIPIVNVIDPIVKYVSSQTNYQHIGLIGTKQTIRSKVYEKKIHAYAKEIQVHAKATPILVPLIEEGFKNHPATQSLLAEYLNCPSFSKIQALILGCTHYPLLKSFFQTHFGKKVDVIDSAELTAKTVQETLNELNLANTANDAQQLFYVSDYNEYFLDIAQMFFEKKINLEYYPLWS